MQEARKAGRNFNFQCIAVEFLPEFIVKGGEKQGANEQCT